MYSLKDLTNIILEIRKTNAQNQELLIKMLEIIEDFYENDTWVICPASHNENNEHFFVLLIQMLVDIWLCYQMNNILEMLMEQIWL